MSHSKSRNDDRRSFSVKCRPAGHVGRVLGDFSFYTSIKFDTAVSAYIFPLRLSYLSSSFIISPLR